MSLLSDFFIIIKSGYLHTCCLAMVVYSKRKVGRKNRGVVSSVSNGAKIRRRTFIVLDIVVKLIF